MLKDLISSSLGESSPTTLYDKTNERGVIKIPHVPSSAAQSETSSGHLKNFSGAEGGKLYERVTRANEIADAHFHGNGRKTEGLV
jgi:hypothetical protein